MLVINEEKAEYGFSFSFFLQTMKVSKKFSQKSLVDLLKISEVKICY